MSPREGTEGSIELEGSRARELLELYDTDARRWTLPKAGDLWDAVAVARDAGLKGRDRRVAVIDDGFATSAGPLADARCRVVMPASPAPTSTDHGTCVALLVAEVAPEAELLLYEVAAGDTIEFDRVTAAVERATRDAHVVNLSLGRERQLEEIPLDERTSEHGVGTAHTCPLCEVTRAADQGGAVVCAAIGNSRDVVTCPAAYAATVACGFVALREDVDSEGVRVPMPAPPWTDDDHDAQATLLGATLVSQPPGVVGSSFATPLVSGFLAATRTDDEIAEWLAFAKLASAAYEWMFISHWGAADRFLSQGAALLPSAHRHWEASDIGPCAACSFFAASWYANYGFTKLRLGLLDDALQLLRVGHAVAPLHPETAANYGFALLASAREQSDSATRANTLRAAVGAYEAALARIKSAEFEQRRDEASKLLARVGA